MKPAVGVAPSVSIIHPEIMKNQKLAQKIQEICQAIIDNNLDRVKEYIAQKARDKGHKNIKARHISDIHVDLPSITKYVLENVNIGDYTLRDQKPLSVSHVVIKNDTPNPQPAPLNEWSRTIKELWNWTFKAGFTYSAKSSVKATIGGTGPEVEKTFEINLEVSRSKSYEEEIRHAWPEKEFTVSPYSILFIFRVITEDIAELDYDAVFKIVKGLIKVHFKVKGKKKSENIALEEEFMKSDASRSFSNPGNTGGQL